MFLSSSCVSNTCPNEFGVYKFKKFMKKLKEIGKIEVKANIKE